MKRVAVILLRTVLALVTLLLLLAAFSQTQFFRDRLRSIALANLQDVLNAEIYLGGLHGNLFAGFVLDSLRVAVDGQPVVSTGSVEFRYNLFALPGRTLSLGSVTLVRPTVRLLCTRGGEWNFERMVRGIVPDTAAGARDTIRLPWKIDIQGVEIRDGVVLLVDSSGGHTGSASGGSVDYRNFTLRGVQLAMAGQFNTGEKGVEIRRLSFEMDTPSFRLRSLTGRARLTRSEAEVTDLHIVTGRSDVTVNATLGGIDLLGGISLAGLRRCPLSASMRLDGLDFQELRALIPWVDFLDGGVSGAIDVSGEFGRLDVTRLYLRHGKTALSLRGTVSNLHQPRDLDLNVRMDENTIDAADVGKLLPGLNLPDVSGIGVARVSARFKGTPLDFATALQVEAGEARLQVPEVALKIGGPRRLAYRGQASFRNLDLAAITGRPSLRSRLTGSVSARGEGVTLQRVAGSFEVRLDSSSFRDEPITDAWFSIGARERRVLARVQATVGGTSGELTGMIDESLESAPAFRLGGTVSGLNLGTLLHEPGLESSITVAIDASGVGLNWKALDGTLLLDFANSRFRDHTIDSGYVQLTVTGADSLHKSVTIGSPVLDVVVDGAFDPLTVGRLFAGQIASIRDELGEKLASIDSSFFPAGAVRGAAGPGGEPVGGGNLRDATFTLQLKNLELLSSLIGGARFVGTGFVTGEMRGQGNDLSLVSSLQLDEFAYGNEQEGGVFLEGADVSLGLHRLGRGRPLENLDFHCNGRIDHLAINRTSFDSLSVDVQYRNSGARFALGISGDERKLRLETEGELGLTRDTVALGLSRFDAAYESYRWAARPGARFALTSGGLRMDGVVLARGDEMVEASGFLGSGRRFTGTVHAKNLDLDFLKYLLPAERSGMRRPFLAGKVEVRLDASGTLGDPEYLATLRADNVLVRDMPLGVITADLRYRQHALTGWLNASAAGGSGPSELRIAGVVPANLVLEGLDGARFPDDPIDLTIRAGRFQLAVLDPFLPAFEDFSGLMDGDLKLRGTLRDPEYEGNVSVGDGSFLFEPNNIAYQYDGEFQAAGRRIQVVRAALRNVEADARQGKRGAVTITGDFALRNFRPGDFNLNVKGDLLVVKESTQRSSLEVSGELFAEIEGDGLQFTGEIDRSLLRGVVNIRNSTLVFPPSQAQVGGESATSVPVVLVDDTTHVTVRKRRAAEQYFTTRNLPGGSPGREDETPTVSFLDGLRYDLEIETGGGTTSIEMIFNSLTAEKLVATINGSFAIRGQKSQWFGELTVSQAYYNFLKRFDAEGTIRYAGDFLNPELDITATYQSRRTVQDSTGRADERVAVIFKITGTKKEPKIETQMKIDDVDYANYRGLTSHDVQSDAIQFIVYGTFPLTLTQRNEANTDLQKQIGVSALSGAASMLTGALSEFLRTQTGFINSVDIRYSGDSAPEIRLSGSALKGYWRFGGRFVEEPLANADFSLLYSMESIFGNPSLRNLMFEFERRVESSSLQVTDFKRVNSARLFYRFSF